MPREEHSRPFTSERSRDCTADSAARPVDHSVLALEQHAFLLLGKFVADAALLEVRNGSREASLTAAQLVI
jgi:hypothetical protein